MILPEPASVTFDKFSTGISILFLPSNNTPAIVLAFSNCVAEFEFPVILPTILFVNVFVPLIV